MKQTKKVIGLAVAFLTIAGLAACGGAEDKADTVANLASDKGGTIMWMASHEDKAIRAGFEALCDSLGYKSVVVYGDGFNDAAGNLSAVRNSMTSDVVALITSQDGGIKDIMEEYPDLYVAGCLSDMNSVYADGGENAVVLSNDHYLGTICDGYADVMDMAPNDSGRSYDERLDSCIDYELDQIFNHSSVIKQIGFIAGLPETFLALAAECAIMAVADPGDPRMNR